MPQWVCDDQRSGIWLKERLGCMTASRAADAFATTKKGESEARKKYRYQLVAERASNEAKEFYCTPAMQRGIDLEPVAKIRFFEETGMFVQNCGFALHDTIPFLGASPDGLVGADALIEIKCPDTSSHILYAFENVAPEKYRPQMLIQLAVTKRKYCWFVSFDDRCAAPRDIFICKYEPTPEEIQAAEKQAMEFLHEVECLWDWYIMNTPNN